MLKAFRASADVRKRYCKVGDGIDDTKVERDRPFSVLMIHSTVTSKCRTMWSDNAYEVEAESFENQRHDALHGTLPYARMFPDAIGSQTEGLDWYVVSYILYSDLLHNREKWSKWKDTGFERPEW